MREVGVSAAFPDPVLREAEAARADAAGRERVELDFATIDPPGSRDLDQAMHIEPPVGSDGGYRVSYAIADVGSLVDAGTAARRRGARAGGDRLRARCEGPALSPAALGGLWKPVARRVATGSALDHRFGRAGRADGRGRSPRRGQERRPAHLHRHPRRVWRACSPRSASCGPGSSGSAAASASACRSRRSLPATDGGWTTRYRAPFAERGPQRADLTPHRNGGGRPDARTRASGSSAPRRRPTSRSLARFRLQARALGHDWPESLSYRRSSSARSIPADPRGAALLEEAAGIGRGARYRAFDGDPPAELADRFHFSIAADYAHATAPLRRLQDRYVSECCLAAVGRRRASRLGPGRAGGAPRADAARPIAGPRRSNAASSTWSRR